MTKRFPTYDDDRKKEPLETEIEALRTIRDSVINRSDKPVLVVALCDDCDWRGKPADCETYQEDDGREGGIEYTVAICPKCKEENVICLTQEEMDGYKDI